jgi:hypothetical protein
MVWPLVPVVARSSSVVKKQRALFLHQPSNVDADITEVASIVQKIRQSRLDVNAPATLPAEAVPQK